MKKGVIIAIVVNVVMIAVFIVTIILTRPIKPNKDWIIGKTFEEVRARYGEFDEPILFVDENRNFVSGVEGTYVHAHAGYIIEPEKKFFLGWVPGKMLYICFDENGIAYKCYTDLYSTHI